MMSPAAIACIVVALVVVVVAVALVRMYNNIVTLRNRIDNAWQNIDTQLQRRTPEAKMAAEGAVAGALRQLFAVAEAYPDLKANQNFSELQASLETTEDKISYARQSYNDCVLNFNNSIQTFPGNVFAGIFHFRPRSGFEADNAARTASEVRF